MCLMILAIKYFWSANFILCGCRIVSFYCSEVSPLYYPSDTCL